MDRLFRRRILVAIIACCLMAGPAFALTVTPAMESIQEEAADLQVNYQYPSFAADDTAVLDALNLAVTQAFLNRYDELHAQYEQYAAARSKEETQAYQDVDYFDTIDGTYEVVSTSAHLLQILAQSEYRPANGNGEWSTVQSYVFSFDALGLITPDDLFAEDAQTVYEALAKAAKEKLGSESDLYSDPDFTVNAETPFTFSEADNTLCLYFNPYTLSRDEKTAVLSLGDLNLAPVDLASIQMSSTIDGPMIGMPNPMREATAEEIDAALGISFKAPEEAADVQYFLYNFGGLDQLAEAQYTLNGLACTLRAEAADELSDISGMYVDFASQEAVSVGAYEGLVKVNEGAEGVCLWYDAEGGILYCLILTDGATAAILTDMANALV